MPKRKRLSRGDTGDVAAYAASQKLYDVLREATDRIEIQAVNLATARDLVQKIHIDLPNIEPHGPEKHEKYMECIVRAWRSATEVYSTVLLQLLSDTQGSSSEDKPAHKHFETFRSLAESANTARTNCWHDDPFDKSEENSQPKNNESLESFTPPEFYGSSVNFINQSDEPLAFRGKQPRASEVNGLQPPQKIPKSVDDLNSGTQLAKLALEQTKAKMKAAKRQLRRAKKAAVRRENQKTAGQDNGTNQEPGTSGVTESQPIEYEDISAEVEARLKAKKELKEAKKSEKKRKRESGASMISLGAPDDVVTPRRSSRPQIKRIKAEEEGTTAHGDQGTPGVKEKRAKEEDGTEVVETRKKRRKNGTQ